MTQATIATSSCEVEYRAAFIATIKCVWLQKLVADLLAGQIAPTVIHTDSQSALAIAQNPVFHARTKQIEVHYHYVRERWLDGDIKLSYIPTEDNLAYLFTLALLWPKFEVFRKASNKVSFVT